MNATRYVVLHGGSQRQDETIWLNDSPAILTRRPLDAPRVQSEEVMGCDSIEDTAMPRGVSSCHNHDRIAVFWSDPKCGAQSPLEPTRSVRAGDQVLPIDLPCEVGNGSRSELDQDGVRLFILAVRA